MSYNPSQQIRRWAAATLLATATGCESAPPPPQAAASGFAARGILPGTVHPTADNLPAPAELAAAITMEPSPGRGTPLARFGRRLAGARELSSLGALEGDASQVFGTIEDVATDESGRLYVLDSRYNNVRIHDASGAPLGSFGGPGGGPDEFRSPEALRRDADGRLLVADRHNRIKVFTPRGGSYQLTGSIGLRLVPEDFCLLGGEIFVQGIAAEGIIHVYSPSGTRLRSLGRPYRTANWLVRNQLSDGPIACSDEAATVVTMFKYLPLVYGFSPTGELRWVSRLDDFRPLRMVEEVDERGRPGIAFDGGRPHDLAESLQAVPGGFVLVQTARLTPRSIEDRKEYAELRTYVISAATGEGVYVGNRLPRISAVTDTRVLAGENDPFPRVRILELPGAREDQ